MHRCVKKIGESMPQLALHLRRFIKPELGNSYRYGPDREIRWML
jgi:hypothetical protein